MKFIRTLSGKPGSGKARTVYASGATSDDLSTAQFFMTMQDRGHGLDEARSYASIGPSMSPSANWPEINRVLATFQSKAANAS